ncbi:hypothetical protein [Carboxylicivirga sp. RSCT41]|uniref:hypothetical protein n=1 Tax=Carboxylicivirga agarovorans TaxID=3417570 RepID=UPI003D35185A
MKRITIKGRQYEVKETFRAIFDFEEKYKKLTPELLKEQFEFLYFILKNANRKDKEDTVKFKMTFDQFIDVLEEDKEIFNTLNDALAPDVPESTEDGESEKKN